MRKMSQKKISYQELGSYSKQLLDYNPIKRKKKKVKKELRIMRVLCQRPYFTGSGINLVNLIKKTAEKGLEQYVIYGQPVNQSHPLKDIIDEKYVFPVKFSINGHSSGADVSFPVAGMSDYMPYESTKFSSFTKSMLEQYLTAFVQKIKMIYTEFNPTLIHSHHLWLVSALCRVFCPHIPIVATCHNTGFRQMELSPQLKNFVVNPIQDIDAIAVIGAAQEQRVKKIYEFKKNLDIKDFNGQFFYIGQGINTSIFNPPKKPLKKNDFKESFIVIYVGKLNYSKGVPHLIEAFKRLCEEEDITLDLYLVGSGKGKQKDNIYKMASERDNIHFIGQIEQEQLSKYFKDSDLFVLPSFYEGFPKVLLESLSCGCRAIVTDLPGLKDTLIKSCGDSDIVQYLSLPPMESIDTPKSEGIPQFVENLKKLMKKQLKRTTSQKDLEFAQKIRSEFSWEGLFHKYMKKYRELLLYDYHNS